MATISEDYMVQCPFYKTNTSQVLYCEGLEDGMAIHLAFATRSQLNSYKMRYCRKIGYCACPLARILEEKYGDK